jgi:hypothetical protein
MGTRGGVCDCGLLEGCDCGLLEGCKCEGGDGSGRGSFGGGDVVRYQDSDVVAGVLS